MLTYQKIIEETEKKTRRKLYHTCWIAEVKRHYGLTRGPAHNSGIGKGAPPCPVWAWTAIEQILKKYGLI